MATAMKPQAAVPHQPVVSPSKGVRVRTHVRRVVGGSVLDALTQSGEMGMLLGEVVRSAVTRPLVFGVKSGSRCMKFCGRAGFR